MGKVVQLARLPDLAIFMGMIIGGTFRITIFSSAKNEIAGGFCRWTCDPAKGHKKKASLLDTQLTPSSMRGMQLMIFYIPPIDSPPYRL